jgi:UDP-N-acetylglucosamine 2-epimerase
VTAEPARLKVMTIVGTRPEVIKLSRVVAELERHTDHRLVHSGQNYDHGLNQVFFDELGIGKPDHVLDAVGSTVAESIGLIISRSDQVMAAERPDALLLYGDTNTCLAVIAAKRRRIPVFHLEAGNRCFDDRVPEEVNRRLVDHLSDVNLPLTEHARRHLLAEGLRPETVLKVGSPMKEVLEHYRAGIDRSPVLSALGLEPGRYLLVSAHREENVDVPDKLGQLVEALRALAGRHRVPVIVSTHPRTRARLAAAGLPAPADPGAGVDADPGAEPGGRLRWLPPFGYLDWVQLQRNALCVVSDSGTLTEEASLLGFPAVMIRDAHERPEGMDEGVLVASGLRPDRVLAAVDTVTSQHARAGRPGRVVPDYDADGVSRKVVRIVLSYVAYVNRTVWSDASGER